MRTSWPALRSATGMNWPVVTAVPLWVNVPAVGSVVIFTASRLLAGLSLESLKPKSEAPKVYGVSSSVVAVLAVPCGVSFTEVTFTVRVRGVGSRSTPPFTVLPSSWTWKVNVA